MLTNNSRIPLSETETETVDYLLTEHAGKSASLTRRDPGESGPVLVHVDASTFQITGSKMEKVSS